jgi:hypothetical protein
VEEHSSDEEHGDFDPQQLREHEEFTKVGKEEGGGATGARVGVDLTLHLWHRHPISLFLRPTRAGILELKACAHLQRNASPEAHSS